MRLGLILLVLPAACATTGSTPQYAKQWPKACKKLKDRLRSPAASARSVPLPPREAERDPWMISLGSLSASLPEDRYVLSVSRSGRSGESLSILLRAAQQMVLLIKDPPSPPLEDVFAKVGQLAPGQQAKKHTLKLFGKAPTVHDLAEMGYQHSPDELSCSAKTADREIPVAISLILKDSGHWAEKVFWAEEIPGLVYFGDRGQRCLVEARPHDGTADYFVTYTTSDRKGCEARLKRFRLVKGGKDQGPEWIEALGRAVRNPGDLANWESLHRALVSANAPVESIRSVMKLIEAARTP